MYTVKENSIRHNEDGERLVTATIYSDGASTPSSAAEVPGLLETDKFDVGCVCLDTTTGNVSMWNGASWSNW